MQVVSGLSRQYRAGCEAAKGQVVYSLCTAQFPCGIRQSTPRQAEAAVPSLRSNIDAVGGKLKIVAEFADGEVAITN